MKVKILPNLVIRIAKVKKVVMLSIYTCNKLYTKINDMFRHSLFFFTDTILSESYLSTLESPETNELKILLAKFRRLQCFPG